MIWQNQWQFTNLHTGHIGFESLIAISKAYIENFKKKNT